MIIRTLRAGLLLAVLTASATICGGQTPPAARSEALASIQQYIHATWDTLTRSTSECGSVTDPKLRAPSILYLPQDYPEPDAVRQMSASCNVRALPLPAKIKEPGQANVRAIDPPGLLFLPNPYVVPGGRFNEMYGWDSYFIVLGLLQDGRLELARDMVENFFFEIEHYGTVLNANRTYYLTRSQPPFLTSMILEVYRADKRDAKMKRGWLERAYKFAAHDYEMWTHTPHLAGDTGLSRYYDFGEGPAPESEKDETGLQRKVAGYFLVHPGLTTEEYLKASESGARSSWPQYVAKVCDAATETLCDAAGTLQLTDDYYKGDRSLRESGFDITFRFGPYGAATHHFAPVGLNSLLYKAEDDLAWMAQELGNKTDATQWLNRAARRKRLVNQYLWDARRGLFFDYDFTSGKRSNYEFLTTFYPLWVGMATKEQAREVERNLKIFEHAGGLATSTFDSGVQWDYPFGWAPLQLLAVEGIRRYSDERDANRVAEEFLSTVLENFERDKTIREKYNVVTGSSQVAVSAGYQTNVVGFGWTNGVFVRLLRDLPPAAMREIQER